MALLSRSLQHENLSPENQNVSPPSSTLDEGLEDLFPAPAAGKTHAAYDHSPYPFLTWRIAMMGILVSMGKQDRRVGLASGGRVLTKDFMI